MLTIKDRCIRAEQAFASYSDDDPGTNLLDLLADAMHWCRAEGHDFAAMLGTAEMHFQEETYEEEGTYP